MLPFIGASSCGSGGDGVFTDIPTAELADAASVSDGACWADVDGDSDEDLYVTGYRGLSRLWRNDGGGSFTDITASARLRHGLELPSGCAFVDIDNDGDP